MRCANTNLDTLISEEQSCDVASVTVNRLEIGEDMHPEQSEVSERLVTVMTKVKKNKMVQMISGSVQSLKEI